MPAGSSAQGVLVSRFGHAPKTAFLRSSCDAGAGAGADAGPGPEHHRSGTMPAHSRLPLPVCEVNK